MFVSCVRIFLVMFVSCIRIFLVMFVSCVRIFRVMFVSCVRIFRVMFVSCVRIFLVMFVSCVRIFFVRFVSCVRIFRVRFISCCGRCFCLVWATLLCTRALEFAFLVYKIISLKIVFRLYYQVEVIKHKNDNRFLYKRNATSPGMFIV